MCSINNKVLLDIVKHLCKIKKISTDELYHFLQIATDGIQNKTIRYYVMKGSLDTIQMASGRY